MEIQPGDKFAARMLILCIQLPVFSELLLYLGEYLFILYLSDDSYWLEHALVYLLQ